MGKKQKAASAVARTSGSFLGGITNNPGIVIIVLVLGGLFLFRDKISEGLGSLGEGLLNIELPAFPEIKFPDITFPDFNFPEFPEITFPEFPDFTNIFSGIQEQLDNLFANQASILAGQTVAGQGAGQTIDIPGDTTVNPDGTVSSTTPPISTGAGATQEEFDFAQARAAAFDTLFDLDVLSGQQIQQAISAITFGDFSALQALIVSIQSLASNPPGLTPAQEFALGKGLSPEQEAQIIVPTENVNVIGGGVSFIGGTTTFGSGTNLVDTLTEVLNLFPGLTASQAANALNEFPGLTPNEFRLINPIVPSISSAGVDPEQIFLNSSGGLSGLTPEQIFKKLFGNIQNF